MGASVYAGSPLAYAVTPSTLPPPAPGAPPVNTQTPDILNAGGPPPLNALTIPSIGTGGYAPTDPTTGLAATGPTGGTINLSPYTTTATATPPPITTATPVAVKPLGAQDTVYNYDQSMPYTRLQRGILYAEGGRPGEMVPTGRGDYSYGPWQIRGSTMRSPGLGLEPPDMSDPQAAANKFAPEYLEALYNRYGGEWPMTAAAWNWGYNNVDKMIAQYGDPRKGQIDMATWVSKLPSQVRDYIHKVAGGQMALPAQTPPAQTETAAVVGRPSVVNPLAIQPQSPQSSADLKDMMHKYWTMAALSTLLPAGFAFHKVAYDPRDVLAVAKGQFSGVRGGTMPMSGMPRSFGQPVRPVLGAGAGPQVVAYSPATVPGFEPVRRRS